MGKGREEGREGDGGRGGGGGGGGGGGREGEGGREGGRGRKGEGREVGRGVERNREGGGGRRLTCLCISLQEERESLKGEDIYFHLRRPHSKVCRACLKPLYLPVS